MSVNFDPVDLSVPPPPSSPPTVKNSSVQPSTSIVASLPSSSPAKKLYPVCKLIAFPSNNSTSSSPSTSSLSVNGSDYTKKKSHQLCDKQQERKYLNANNCTVSGPSLPLEVYSYDENIIGTRKSLDSFYSNKISDISSCCTRLDREWCLARKKQLDEIIAKLQQLHKVNLDDRENIEGMKKRTTQLIATYSGITMKTNSFLTRWDRKYGFKLKAIQTTKPSSSFDSPSSPSSSFSSSFYDEKFDPNYLFNSTPIC